MSLVKDMIQSLVKEGEITHEFTLQGIKFTLRALSTEEQIVADGIIDTDKIREKYGIDDFVTLNDTLSKYRSISLVALSIKSMNGQSPVDAEKSPQEQFKQRMELREELMALNAYFVSELSKEYNKLRDKQVEFYENLNDHVEK